MPAALAAGSAEAASSFGDGSVYLEREIRPARHIEVQLLGDATGRIIAVGERDCSLQRRHQKLVEEAPAPGLSGEERRRLHDLAVRVASAAGLRNAATAEFLRAADGTFYFLEVNTRLQVEHGVTELVAGIWTSSTSSSGWRPVARCRMLRSPPPNGPPIPTATRSRSASPPRIRRRDFAPGPGRIRRWLLPAGPGVRVDTGLTSDDRVPPDYDNLVAKVMVHARDRDAAIDRLRRALDETEIAGIQTTLPFHRFVARHDGFRAGDLSIDWVAEQWDGAAERSTRCRGSLPRAAARAVAAGDVSWGGRRIRPTGPRWSPGGWAAAARSDATDRWPR